MSEVYVIQREGYLKVVPKRKVDLTKFLDKADLGVDAIGNWENFERIFSYKRNKKYYEIP